VKHDHDITVSRADCPGCIEADRAIAESEAATRIRRWPRFHSGWAPVLVGVLLLVGVSASIVVGRDDEPPPEWEAVVVKDPARLGECLFYRQATGEHYLVGCVNLDTMQTGNADIFFIGAHGEGDYLESP
jgi:hypothetical protein